MNTSTLAGVAVGPGQGSDSAVVLRRESPFSTKDRQLTECVYISVICVPCECVRVALPEEPKQQMIECPACGAASWWKLLARGATVRPLPFYQRMRLGEDRRGKNRVPWTDYDTYESERKEGKEDRESPEDMDDDDLTA